MCCFCDNLNNSSDTWSLAVPLSEVLTGGAPEAGPVDCYTFMDNQISVTSQLLCGILDCCLYLFILYLVLPEAG